jgi:putative ABC transport system substrate-binding protein
VRRRDFITGISAATAWPLAVRAQEAGRLYRLGFLIPAARTSAAVDAMFDEFRRGGLVEGQNLVVIGRFGVTNEQIGDAVSAVVTATPDAIVAGPELYTRALQAATLTVPLVSISEDLVGEGLVASLARPGGNITGISLLSPELDDKRQDILIEAVPGIRRMAALAATCRTKR